MTAARAHPSAPPDIACDGLSLPRGGGSEKHYSGKIDFARGKHLIGSHDVIKRIQSGQDPEEIEESYRDTVDAFLKVRQKYLLYK